MKKMIKKNLTLFILFFSILNPLFANESNLLTIGSVDSKVTIKVFSSLTCPHCASFHEKIFKKLKNEYIDTGKVKFEHHGFPLDLAALNAEKLLRCVNNKEKSFELLDEIYKEQNQWAVGSDINKINESIKKIGLRFKLKEDIIDKCLQDEKVADQILNERINAQKNYKISSTPTIYINKKKYEGKHDFKSFKKSLEKLL
jgi:protein-disulfide isomerase